MLTSTCAILPCRDMDRTVEFFTKLGFELQGRWDNFGGYLIFQKDAVEVHFFQRADHVPETSHHAAYIRTDAIEDWAEELAALDLPVEGIPRLTLPEDAPWGMRELAIVDPDGNLFRVGQHLG